MKKDIPTKNLPVNADPQLTDYLVGSNAAGTSTFISLISKIKEAISDGLWGAGAGTESIVSVNTSIPNAAAGNNSVSIGSGTKSDGVSSFAAGLSTNANGAYSAAFGSASESTGQYSFACNNSFATGNLSFSSGTANTAAGSSSAALGGVGSTVDAGSPRSVILGGSGNSITGEPDLAQAQNLRITTDLRITQAANGPAGLVILTGLSKTVSNTNVKTGAYILLTRETVVGVPGILSCPQSNIVNGVSFDIVSDNAADVGTVFYLIINP